MPSFIKLADRTILANIVHQLRKGTSSVHDPKAAPRHYDPVMIVVPALFLDLQGKQTLTYVFENDKSRDIEYARIDSILLSKPQFLFNDLFLDPNLIQSVHVAWSNIMQNTLRLRIKVPETYTFTVFVSRDEKQEWDRAEQLLARFGLKVPETILEGRKRLRDEGDNGI